MQHPEFILAVDDHPGVQTLLRQFLEGLGYQVRLAASGEEALAIISHELPALILLDIKMPGIGGLETLRRIKDQIPSVPVIVISAYSELKLVENVLREGLINDYLEKPFDLKRLSAMVELFIKKTEKLNGGLN